MSGMWIDDFLMHIWASLSEPHTGVTSLHMCMCMPACLLGPTNYRKSLPALILHILRNALIQKGLEDMNHEQSTSLMVTTRTETYLFSG